MYTRKYLLCYYEFVKELFYRQWLKKQKQTDIPLFLNGLTLYILIGVNYYILLVNSMTYIFKTNCIFAV